MGLEPSKLTPRRTGTDTLLSALKNFGGVGDYYHESAQRDITINWKTLICLNDLKRKYLKNFSIIVSYSGITILGLFVCSGE